MSGSAGTGYVVAPDSGHGPGILVLHSWWGLTPYFRTVCDRLADAGFVALAPDLHGGDQTAATPDEAEALLAATDPNQTAGLVVSSLTALARMPATSDGPVGVLGFSMGASWALWPATPSPDQVAAVSPYYASQALAFEPMRAPVQGHFAAPDEFTPEDDVNYLEAQLRLVGRSVDFHRYAGTGHWFAEADRPPAHDPVAAELAWARTVDFFQTHLH